MTTTHSSRSIIGASSYESAVVSLMLTIHTGLLIHAAATDSPTFLEPAQLASGLAHWEFGDYVPFRANPPLIRMVAAIPALMSGYQMDWASLSSRNRPEYQLGIDLIQSNHDSIMSLFLAARIMCIPFAMCGAICSYLLARDLWGSYAGMLAVFLWSVDPNIIGHGHLVSTDIPAASMVLLVIHTFFKWHTSQAVGGAVCSGVALGFALLTKFTLCILIPILLGVVILRFAHLILLRKIRRCVEYLGHAIIICATPLLMINMMYQFKYESAVGQSQLHGGYMSLWPLSSTFVSDGLPIPTQYSRGMIAQLHDIEEWPWPTYWCGQWRETIPAAFALTVLAVKVPHSIQGLFIISIIALAVFQRSHLYPVSIALICVFVCLMIVSGWSRLPGHLRYLLPGISPCIVIASYQAKLAANSLFFKTSLCIGVFAHVATLWNTFPNHLSYCNELSGGIYALPKYFVESDVDLGQDLLRLREWQQLDPKRNNLFVAIYGRVDPRLLRITCLPVKAAVGFSHRPQLVPGFYAISVSLLKGMRWYGLSDEKGHVSLYAQGDLSLFDKFRPAFHVGGSILIFEVRENEPGN